MKKTVLVGWGIVAMLVASFSVAPMAMAEEGGAYYTKQNIWYEKPEKILSTNYHKGSFLPAGSQVSILKRGSKIKFKDQAGTEYKIILVENFTSLSEDQFFDRYFSNQNILNSPEYNSFSVLDKDNIRSGTITEGMSKAATLIAWGYPPSHRTSSTESNTWTYWVSRLITKVVHFENGKIVSFSKSK